MFHSGTQTLIAAWEALAEAAGGVPTRRQAEAAAFAPLLPQLAMLERRGDGAAVRFAGAWVEGFAGRALAGADWHDLWRTEARPLATLAVRVALREGRPVVVMADVGGAFEPLEVALAPLRAMPDRLLALVQPLTAAGRALERAGMMGATAVIAVGEPRRAPLALAVRDGRRVA